MTASSPAYRPDIDGLRGIAVLAVVAYHAFPRSFPAGFIGVDVFFVISGYLISSIILSDLSRGRFSYRSFYARRARRLFPALTLVLVAALVAGWLTLFPDEFSSLGRQVFGGAAFLANVILWQQTGYFDEEAHLKPLLHLWSLGIEEQFYLVWPTALVMIWRRRHRLALVLALGAGSFALNLVFSVRSPDANFYLPFTRLWELLIGVVVAVMAQRVDRAFAVDGLLSLMAWGGLALLVVGMAVIDVQRPFPGWWALLPTVGTALLIAAGPTTWPNRALLAQRALVYVGLISYPLYLWHWLLLVFSNILTANAERTSLRLAVVSLSVMLAWATYQFVERPIRFELRHRSVTFSLVLVLLVIGVAGYAVSVGSISPRSAQGEFRRIWDAMADWAPLDAFNATRFQTVVLRRLGDPSKPQVLYFGDSNLEQFGPRLERLIRESPERHKAAIFATIGGCPPVRGIREKNRPGCPQFIEDTLLLAASDEVDSVVVGACWICYLRPDPGASREYDYYWQADGERLTLGGDGSPGDEAALASLGAMLASLARSKTTYLVLNVPSSPSVDPRNMIARDILGEGFTLIEPRLTRAMFLDKYGGLRTRLRAVAETAGAKVIDPLESLCPGAVCPSLSEDGRPLYRDAVHLRPFYVRERASLLDVTLELR